MPRMNTDIAASTTPHFVAAEHLENQPEIAGPSSSKLAGRTEIGTNPAPRASILTRLANFGRTLLARIFPSRQTGAPRVENDQHRETIFTDKLSGVANALMSDKATPQDIKQALLEADAAGEKLKAAHGRPGKLATEAFQKFCESATSTQLNQLVRAFGSEAVALAQRGLAAHPGAEQLLISLQELLNAELGTRAEKNVADEIATAASVVLAKGPPERVTEHLRLAFASASPMTNSGMQMRPQSDKAVRELILKQLEAQPGETLWPLLAHLSPEHLWLLREDVKDMDHRLIKSQLEKEIQSRPQRLFETLKGREKDFLRTCNGGQLINANKFMSELAVITSTLRALQKHGLHFGTSAPEGFENLQKSLTQGLENAIRSRMLNLDALNPAQVTEVSNAFNLLGAAKVGAPLLEGARKTALDKCVANYEQSLSHVGTHLAANQPEEFLKGLSQLAQSRQALMDMSRAFSTGADRVDAGKLVDEATARWLDKLPASELPKLKAGAAAASFGQLGTALVDGRNLARKAQDPKLANELQSMQDLLLILDNAISAKAGRAEPAPALAEPMKQALGKLYGIELDSKSVQLNTGSFNRQQTQMAAAVIEEPLSVKEMKCVKLGPHDVGPVFHRDQVAGNGKPLITIETPHGTQPLIDRTNWPSAENTEAQGMQSVGMRVVAAKEARVQAGYERLVDFCGGNVDEARSLSFHLQQGIYAGLASLDQGPDSPLKLEDGTAGRVGKNQYGGGGDSIQVHLSRGPNGRPIFDVTHRYEGRNTFTPADGGKEITLSADSVVSRRFRAELVDGNLKLLAPPSYSFHLKADDFPKMYEPPTSGVIRAMDHVDDSLKEVMAFSTRIGKDNQVTAMRAADAFRKKPNLLNAADVIREIDRGDDELKALVPQTAREHVQRATENCRNAITAAFSDAKMYAELRVKNGVAANEGTPAHEANQFLDALKRLEGQTGDALLRGAEAIFNHFIDKNGRNMFGGTASGKIDTALKAARETAEAPGFADDLFGNLTQGVAKRVDAEVSQPMIEAIKRGEI